MYEGDLEDEDRDMYDDDDDGDGYEIFNMVSLGLCSLIGLNSLELEELFIKRGFIDDSRTLLILFEVLNGLLFSSRVCCL